MKNKIKILIISGMYPSIYNPIAGIFVQEQIKELIKQNCEVTVISPQPFVPFPVNLIKSEWNTYSKIPLKEIRDKITTFYPKYLTMSGESLFILKGLVMPYNMRSFIKSNLTKDFDIIHAHLTGFHMGWLAKSLKERLNKPLVITLHGSKSTYPKEKIRRVFMNKVLNSADKIIPVSNYLKNNVLKYGIDEKKIIVVGNGVNKKKFHSISKKKARVILELPIDKKIVLNIASLSKIKGQANLITAFLKLKQQLDRKIMLIVIGEGELKQELRKMAGEELDKSILFVGRKSHEEIPLWLSASDLFVLPSFNESMPVSLLEALACGKPVVATKVGGIPEVINSEDYGFIVNPGNISQLCTALNEALEKNWDENKITQYGSNFTWEKVVCGLIKIYKNILRGSDRDVK